MLISDADRRWAELVAELEKLGAILWEPGEEGVAGWAVCPCCGEHDLWIHRHGKRPPE